MTLFLKCTYLAYKYNHSTILFIKIILIIIVVVMILNALNNNSYDLHIFVDIFALFVDKITAVLNIKGIQNHHIATLFR